MVNVAVGRQTWQSSTLEGNNGRSYLAVDGSKDTRFWWPGDPIGHCAHTDRGDLKPWWAVDLGKVTNVNGVAMTLRDCCWGT